MTDLSGDQQAAVQVGEPRRAQAIELAILQVENAELPYSQKPHHPE
jgi:hypothetical protein